jgi:hypothetical protein
MNTSDGREIRGERSLFPAARADAVGKVNAVREIRL